MSGRIESFREHARSYRDSARAESAAGNAPSTATRWIGPSAARECRSHRKAPSMLQHPLFARPCCGVSLADPELLRGLRAVLEIREEARLPTMRPRSPEGGRGTAATTTSDTPWASPCQASSPEAEASTIRPARRAPFRSSSCERAFLRGRSAEETENARFASPGAGLDGKPLRANATSNSISGTPRWLHQTRGARHAECFRRSRRPDCAWR
jgi:hypothetical protein